MEISIIADQRVIDCDFVPLMEQLDGLYVCPDVFRALQVDTDLNGLGTIPGL